MKFSKSASVLMLATAGCVLASTNIQAQSMEVVTVEAVREVVVGKSAIGAPIKELSIRSHVSYADLDLKTAAGAKELEKRIRDTATTSCNEFNAGFDIAVEGWTPSKCITAAVDGAMGQAKQAIDAAAKK